MTGALRRLKWNFMKVYKLDLVDRTGIEPVTP